MSTNGLLIRIKGRVQGVGFRPFVFRLATSFGIKGRVRNTSFGVEVEAFGEAEALRNFLKKLIAAPPPLARICSVSVRSLSGLCPDDFEVSSSRDSKGTTLVSPDIATCSDCLRELFDPSDRRYLYPFTNCTNCGPRYTVIEGLPYDRVRTTMKVFEMCPECRREYEDPLNRRFHAEPIACPRCGPRVWIEDRRGERVSVKDVWEFVVKTLLEGAIWAIKGLGGFHLACDAENEEAVKRLRERKRRPAKPFAVMASFKKLKQFAEVSEREREALLSPESPIVLLKKKNPFPLAPSVAPGIAFVGVMLPYTPLHHILISLWPKKALVMTSGNVSDSPMCFLNEEAHELSPLVDFFLLHDRDIVVPVDDSVLRFADETRILVRRARGFAPEPLRPSVRFEKGPRLLAVGPRLKNTFSLFDGQSVVLSPHTGDLEDYKTLKLWKRVLAHYLRLFGDELEAVVCDLHPDYLSTRVAEEISEERKVPLFKVQHHAAHAFSALRGVESSEALAVVLDGAGLGEDGTIWGGEVLEVRRGRWRRVARLEEAVMPGGEMAEVEPWRMALSYLGEDPDLSKLLFEEVSEEAWAAVSVLVKKGIGPVTSSAGRLFEAAGVLTGLGIRNSYEGELALRLESVASGFDHRIKSFYDFPVYQKDDALVLGARRLMREFWKDLRKGTPPAEASFRFHLSFVKGFVKAVKLLSERTGLKSVLLSGGCFQNALLLKMFKRELLEVGLVPVFNEEVPPNDGGISYGQILCVLSGNYL